MLALVLDAVCSCGSCVLSAVATADDQINFLWVSVKSGVLLLSLIVVILVFPYLFDAGRSRSRHPV